MDGVLYAPIFVNRCMSLASQFAFRYMTMASLLAWRATCRDNYLVGTKALRHSLLVQVARFFPDPTALLRYLTRWGALIVGEAALSHILYDPTICNMTFELAVGNLVFDPFVRRLSKLLPFTTHVLQRVDRPPPSSFPFRRHITRLVEFRLVTGQVVVVYESCTPSACDVVCGAWTTALMNFVTESTFGCAYPRLTLNYCGLLCDSRYDSMVWADHALQDLLRSKGFEFTSYSRAWPLYSIGPYSTVLPTTSGCGRAIHVCPFQGRYFGDPGSLVVFFDGFMVNREGLRDACVAPYGPMTVWRLPSSDTCESRCIDSDPVIPPFVTSVLMQFAEDTVRFTRRRDLTYRFQSGWGQCFALAPGVQCRNVRAKTV